MTEPNRTEYLPVDNAIKRIFDTVEPIRETEMIASKKSVNCVLAAEMKAQKDIPSADNSAMDGYLFLTRDLESGKRTFEVHGEVRPEDDAPNKLRPGTALEIMTGAPVPAGDFTVVPVELTEKKGSIVTVKRVPERSPIRKRGEGYQKGKVVLARGTVIRPYEIGLMIESGNMNCTVLKPIRISVQVTGSEIDEDMNSNGPVLEGLINYWPGVSVRQWPVLEDQPELVYKRMQELVEWADIVVTTGGISMGKHDYIMGVMEKLGADIVVRKVQQKPGKPFTVTRLNRTHFFHLPGNPISAVFSAEYYLKKAVYSMLGLQRDDIRVRTAVELRNERPDKTLFVPGKLSIDDQYRLRVNSEGKMKSHLLQLYRDSDVYIRLEPETLYSIGDPVTVIPYSTTRLE